MTDTSDSLVKETDALKTAVLCAEGARGPCWRLECTKIHARLAG